MCENQLPAGGFVMPYSEYGELLGHITLGIELVNVLWRKVAALDEWKEWMTLEPANEDVRLHLLHLIASQPNTPLAECVVIGNQGEDDPVRSLYPYLSGVPMPENGFIAPSDAPGIGVTVNSEWLEE